MSSVYFQFELFACYQSSGKIKSKKMILDGETGADSVDETLAQSPVSGACAPEEVGENSDYSLDLSGEDEDYLSNDHDVLSYSASPEIDVIQNNKSANPSVNDILDVIQLNNSVKPSESNLIEADCENVALNNLIAEEYCQVAPTTTLEPIDSKLAKILTSWLRDMPPHDKIKELFKDCMIPINVDGLNPVKINSLVYDKLNVTQKVNDQKLRGINTFLTRGLGPLVAVWDTLLKWESGLQTQSALSERVPQLSVSGQVITYGELKIDFHDLRKKLDGGIHLLSACNSVLLKR